MVQNSKSAFFFKAPINPIQDGHFRGYSRKGGKMFPPPQNLSHISYKDKTWHFYTLAKEDPKNK